MADPFPIISVAEIGVHVSRKITTLVAELDDAPNELLALSNEIWCLQLVLDGLREFQNDPKGLNALYDQEILTLLCKTQITLGGLNKVATNWGRLSNYGDSWKMGKRARFLWLKEKECVIREQLKLRELRANIVSLVGNKFGYISLQKI